jgi:hypothetical protein
MTRITCPWARHSVVVWAVLTLSGAVPARSVTLPPQDPAKADTTRKKEKPLPLEAARTVALDLTEGSWD